MEKIKVKKVPQLSDLIHHFTCIKKKYIKIRENNFFIIVFVLRIENDEIFIY